MLGHRLRRWPSIETEPCQRSLCFRDISSWDESRWIPLLHNLQISELDKCDGQFNGATEGLPPCDMRWDLLQMGQRNQDVSGLGMRRVDVHEKWSPWCTKSGPFNNENRALVHENRALVHEKWALVHEKRALVHEKGALCIKREPLCTERDPLCTKRELLCTKREPLCTKGKPLCTKREPLCTKTEPLCTKTEPLCTERKPLCTERKPLCTKREPFCTKKPLCTKREPVCTNTESLVHKKKTLVHEKRVIVREIVPRVWEGPSLTSCWYGNLLCCGWLMQASSALYCEILPHMARLQQSTCWFHHYNAELFLSKPWRLKGVFQLWIIINVSVISFLFIWIPVLWVYGHYKYLNYFSAAIFFLRQILTSTDVRIWRKKTIPALKGLSWYK